MGCATSQEETFSLRELGLETNDEVDSTDSKVTEVVSENLLSVADHFKIWCDNTVQAKDEYESRKEELPPGTAKYFKTWHDNFTRRGTDKSNKDLPEKVECFRTWHDNFTRRGTDKSNKDLPEKVECFRTWRNNTVREKDESPKEDSITRLRSVNSDVYNAQKKFLVDRKPSSERPKLLSLDELQRQALNAHVSKAKRS